jgi:type IV pilus assembly protein PilM
LKKSKKSFTAVGLDIGNHSVKCVQMERRKDKIVLKQAAVFPLAGQSADNLTAIVKPFTDIIKASPDHVRFVFSGSSALVRCVALPIMTQNELKSAIRFEAENHIAFPIDDCILDFQILNQVPDKKVMNVLLVAAKRDFIQERLKMLLDLDIHPEFIDVDTFSLINAYDLLNACPPEKTVGLLNVGHRVSSFAILQEGVPLFVREIPMGGSAVTKAIAEAKGITEDEAESIKVAHQPEALAELKEATQHGLEPIVEEVKSSIDYYENNVGEAFKSVWLSGGGSLAEGAIEFLTAGLGKQAAFWDPSKKLVFEGVDPKFLQDNAALLNVALGMGLRD